MRDVLSQALGADLLDEIVGLTRDLIRVDSTNPPGSETLAVQVLEEYLARNGIESERAARDPARANLIARVRGRARGRRWHSSATRTSCTRILRTGAFRRSQGRCAMATCGDAGRLT